MPRLPKNSKNNLWTKPGGGTRGQVREGGASRPPQKKKGKPGFSGAKLKSLRGEGSTGAGAWDEKGPFP